MIKLRTILLCRYFYFGILIIVLIISFFRLSSVVKSNYKDTSKNFIGEVISVTRDDSLFKLIVEDEFGERVNASYYVNNKVKNNFISYCEIGDKVEVGGKFERILEIKTKNIFNYQEYASRNKMFYRMKIDYIIKRGKSKNVFLIIKSKVYKYIDSYKNGKYLKLILLGDKSGISKKVINSFRDNGISHLFAISGMHVGVVTSIILKILSLLKIKENKRYFITCLGLAFYLGIIGGSPSIVRAFFFFLFSTINKIYYFYVDNKHVFILTLGITLLINPYYLYDVGFQYSFLISYALIISENFLGNGNNYFINLLRTSCISFLISIPITVYHFYQVNILGIFYNLFYVPLVTFIIFPLSLIILICPFLSFLYDILIVVLEKSSLFINQIDMFKVIFGKINIYYIILEVVVFLFFLWFRKKRWLILFTVLLLFHYLIYSVIDTDYIVMLDVGQGDSFIVHSRGETALIDTGGKVNYKSGNSDNNSIVLNVTIPYLKSKGIRRISTLVLTHGDFDHLGETFNLIDNFEVDEILINEGRKNFLERKIVNDFRNVGICREGDYFEIGNFKFLSLNHDLGDENSSSIVLYVSYDNYKMLFMGDANFKSEKYLLDNYDIGKVNLLKLGHHGSKSSSHESFLKKVRPDVALISAGRNNKFKHPSIETMKRLEKYGINFYSTQTDGTVEFNFTLGEIFT